MTSVPNFSPVSPRSILAVGAVLPSLATIAVSLRFYIRLSKPTKICADDWLVLASLVLTIGLGVMLIVGSAVDALGQPTPLGDGPMGFMFVLNRAIIITEKMKWAFNLMQVFVFGTVKLSVIFFYRRIFRGVGFDVCSKILIAIVCAWTVSFFFTVLFQCGTNPWAVWSTLNDFLTHCSDEVMFLKALSISDVVTDGLILALPVPMVWKLKMSPTHKLAVTAVFLLGALAIAAGVTRLVIFIQQLNDSYSVSQGILLMSTYMYWSMVEMGLTIIAACLPTLRPLFGEMLPGDVSKMFRSFLSLRSFTSDGSHRAKNWKLRKESGNTTNLSQTEFAQQKDHKFATEVYAMDDIEAQKHTHPRGIIIQNDVSHTSTAR